MHKKRWFWWLMFILILLFCFWGRKKEYTEEAEESKIIQETEQTQRNDYEKLEESPDIRVILQAGNYEGLYHAKVDVTFPKGGYVLVGEQQQWTSHLIREGERVTIGVGDGFDFSLDQEKLIALLPSDPEHTLIVHSIQRNRQVCSYYGRLEISLQDAGIMVINELPLETYLEGVVPSEMPASYETEALEAQAILARTYAYQYLLDPAYAQFGAHVDDSVAFQVYGNIDAADQTKEAVRCTEGMLLFYEKSLAEVYYYSTSCGYGTDASVWGGTGTEYLQAKRIGTGELRTKDGSVMGEKAETYYLELLQEEAYFRAMIQHPFVDGYEKEDGWYRWSACDILTEEAILLKRLQERYQANPDVILTKTKDGTFVSKPVKKLGTIQNIQITERGLGGVAKTLLIEGSEAVYQVRLEYNIRYVLNQSGTNVTRADGSSAYCAKLLPSGFFYIDTVQDGKNVISYSINGGGYGHGVGMSQNGANRMAKAGLSCEEILQMFFPETIVVSYESNNRDH